ncbi:MAG: dTDP-4-dehydrorhamnose 3,5-epimerase family protein [Comamonadaceae bacterium]|nr:dTDP-4-dehydrorhamnose 3,5-epimerase family protein [Comamonadaceae bacterium]
MTDLGGIKRIGFTPFVDFRGDLLKLYRREIFQELLPKVEEIYLSRSDKNVIRGMHYQLGGKAQDKLVYCISDRMLDISIDLRPDGDLGHVHVEELVGGGSSALLIPGSFAHGVIVLEDHTTFISMSPQPYSPGDERGVRWDTLGVDFGISHPVVTEKDQAWPTLEEVTQQLR